MGVRGLFAVFECFLGGGPPIGRAGTQTAGGASALGDVKGLMAVLASDSGWNDGTMILPGRSAPVVPAEVIDVGQHPEPAPAGEGGPASDMESAEKFKEPQAHAAPARNVVDVLATFSDQFAELSLNRVLLDT